VIPLGGCPVFGFFSKRKDGNVHDKIQDLNKELKDIPVAKTLEENANILKKLFVDVDILILRFIQSSQGNPQKYCLAYCDGVVNSSIINDSIIKPLILSPVTGSGPELIETLMSHVLMVNEAEKTSQYQKITEAITYGDTVLFAESANEAVILNTKEFQLRSISEPDGEKNLLGPREGFTESLLLNLSLTRRKVRTNELKIKYRTFGERTRTKAAICYIDSIVNKQVLKELYQRLDRIEIDGVLDTNYITELIRDAPWSPFRDTGYTERPDVVVGKLLEGRIAVFLDGTPAVLTIPYLFVENFQSSEDYYLNFYYTSFSRLLRMLAFVVTITLPGFYVAIAGYHHEVLPTPFLLNIASERNSVPFPAALEAFLLLLVFDILRETGVRMPSNIGQALSIVGALVIGQAAVAAKLVASPMIIVVAMTGITSLLVPKMNAPIIYFRVFVLVLSTMFGFTGTISGVCFLLIHLLNLQSFGIPQISFSGQLRFQDIKDIFIRAPWWQMKTRPKTLTTDRVRLAREGDGDD
jgi:spore germination protein KA